MEYTFDIDDDLQVGEDYESTSQPRPPLPGNYLFKPGKWDFRKTKSGELVLYRDNQGNPKYPVIGLATVDIVDPIDNARTVAVFADIASNPFERNGQMSSGAADLMRSMNAEATARNTSEVLSQVTEGLAAGQEFRARLDYTAYDKAYADQLLAEIDPNDRKAKNEAYRKAQIRGYKKIQQANVRAGKGELGIYKWVGPSGAVVDVRPALTVFYGAGDSVNLGPDKSLLTQ